MLSFNIWASILSWGTLIYRLLGFSTDWYCNTLAWATSQHLRFHKQYVYYIWCTENDCKMYISYPQLLSDLYFIFMIQWLEVRFFLLFFRIRYPICKLCLVYLNVLRYTCQSCRFFLHWLFSRSVAQCLAFMFYSVCFSLTISSMSKYIWTVYMSL